MGIIPLVCVISSSRNNLEDSWEVFKCWIDFWRQRLKPPEFFLSVLRPEESNRDRFMTFYPVGYNIIYILGYQQKACDAIRFNVPSPAVPSSTSGLCGKQGRLITYFLNLLEILHPSCIKIGHGTFSVPSGLIICYEQGFVGLCKIIGLYHDISVSVLI